MIGKGGASAPPFLLMEQELRYLEYKSARLLLLPLDRPEQGGLNTRPMNYIRLALLLSLLIPLTACSGMPKLFWDVDEGKDQAAYTQDGKITAASKQNPPLEVPPELRADLQVPSGEAVATRSEEKAMPDSYRSAVAGKYVALDAKLYDAMAGQVFSAAIDAMTSLNLPVQSVDSPSGTLTTDWIRKAKSNGGLGMFTGMFGASGPQAVRYRYVVRVLRATVSDHEQAQLEVRTIGQVYDGHNWKNAQLKQKVAEDLFSAFEEQLARTQAHAPKPAAAQPAPADTTVDGNEILTNQ